MSRAFSIWKDVYSNSWEVVMWVEGKFTVVETNIRTRAKAEKSLLRWRKREEARHGQVS